MERLSNEVRHLEPDYVYILLVEDKPLSFDVLGYDLEEIVTKALARYGVPEGRVLWAVADNKVDALEWLDRMSRTAPRARGFDAVIVDLGLAADGEKEEWEGFDVAAAAAAYSWPCAIVGLTAFGHEDVVLAKKEPLDGLLRDVAVQRPIFDEFLVKDQVTSSPDMAVSKLARCIVPTARFVELAKDWVPPVFIVGGAMWRLMRDMIGIAFSPVVGWPLPKVLLLGEPGAGKGMFARSYDRLLRERDRVEKRPIRRPDFQTVNCATLVAAGEGGRVRLFGYNGPRNATLHSAPGVFELATSYPGASGAGRFAPRNAQPEFAAAGVAFLDEFVEMKADLQAAVLNVLEDGEVYRQDGSRTAIGCHVVLATNAPIEQLVGPSSSSVSKRGGEGLVRSDLVDRVPYVFLVPPLRERLDEVEDLVRSLAAHRLRALGGGTLRRGIEIEWSALRILKRAIELGLVNSVRQLQTIAEVGPNECVLTDSNLRWVIEKARLLGIPEERLLDPSSKKTTATIKVTWSQDDVRPLSSKLQEAFQEFAGTAQEFGKWVDCTADVFGPETKKRFAQDSRTWRLGMLRALCDVGRERLESLGVFEAKRFVGGESVWNQVVGPMVVDPAVRDYLMRQCPEKGRSVLAKTADTLVLLAGEYWGESKATDEAGARAIGKLVYPEPKEQLEQLLATLREGKARPALQCAIALAIGDWGEGSSSAAATLVEALGKVLARSADADRDAVAVAIGGAIARLNVTSRELDAVVDRAKSDGSSSVREMAGRLAERA